MINRILNCSEMLKRKMLNPNNVRRYAREPRRCDVHMNELPVPHGPWGPWYKKKQTFYTKILIIGVLWYIFSLSMAIQTGSLFLNWGPPPNPGPPSEMVDDCDDSD